MIDCKKNLEKNFKSFHFIECQLNIFFLDTHCYKVISHPSTATMNSSLIVSAHEDKKIRFFDINSGKLVYQMVAHQDACTDIAIDPTCNYLLSSSMNKIKFFNLKI